jgi:hypothetical protein
MKALDQGIQSQAKGIRSSSPEKQSPYFDLDLPESSQGDEAGERPILLLIIRVLPLPGPSLTHQAAMKKLSFQHSISVHCIIGL